MPPRRNILDVIAKQQKQQQQLGLSLAKQQVGYRQQQQLATQGQEFKAQQETQRQEAELAKEKRGVTRTKNKEDRGVTRAINKEKREFKSKVSLQDLKTERESYDIGAKFLKSQVEKAPFNVFANEYVQERFQHILDNPNDPDVMGLIAADGDIWVLAKAYEKKLAKSQKENPGQKPSASYYEGLTDPAYVNKLGVLLDKIKDNDQRDDITNHVMGQPSAKLKRVALDSAIGHATRAEGALKKFQDRTIEIDSNILSQVLQLQLPVATGTVTEKEAIKAVNSSVEALTAIAKRRHVLAQSIYDRDKSRLKGELIQMKGVQSGLLPASAMPAPKLALTKEDLAELDSLMEAGEITTMEEARAFSLSKGVTGD